MGLYLSKKKIENKIQELNAQEVYIIENEEKLKIKEIEFEEKIKLLNVLDQTNVASIKQLMLWATRLGKDSKAVMMGDTSQYDVKKKDSGYVDFINMTRDMNDLYIFEFKNEDIVRNKFLIELTNRYDKYRSERPNL